MFLDLAPIPLYFHAVVEDFGLASQPNAIKSFSLTLTRKKIYHVPFRICICVWVRAIYVPNVAMGFIGFSLLCAHLNTLKMCECVVVKLGAFTGKR